MFHDESRTKPLRVILEVLANPFTRPVGERPNERERSLWQNPNIGFGVEAVHCLTSVFAFIILLRKPWSKVPKMFQKRGR